MRRFLALILLGQYLFFPVFGQGKNDPFVQDSINGIYIPKDLNDCFTQLDNLLNDTIKENTATMSEEAFVVNSHFGLGLWMRNNWQLWGGSRLSEYFNEMGVHQPDDMSGIILRSYDRYLLKRDIKLEEQVQHCIEYWSKVERYEDSLRADFSRYAIGDTVCFNYLPGFSSRKQEKDFHCGKCIATGVVTGINVDLYLLQVCLIKGCARKGIISFNNNQKFQIYKTDYNPTRGEIKYLKPGEKDWFHYLNWVLIKKS